MKAKNGLKRMGMAQESNMTYQELYEKFIKKCQVNNLSPYTIDSYRVANRYFGRYVNLETLKLSEIQQELVDDYILYLMGTGIKPITVNTYVRHVASVLKYGMELKLIKQFQIKEIRVTEEIKEVYTEEELLLLLKKPNGKMFAEYRNWVIVNFLLGTGVRALELRNIKVGDLNLYSSMLLLKKTKNKKQRYVPISNALNEILQEYIEIRNPINEEDYLFCNEFGEYMPRTTLQHGITKYCRRRGVEKHSLHLFRHTFSKMWILNGGDIFILQRILGHSSLKMVNHYANLYATDLQRNYDKFCALDSIIKHPKEVIKLKS